MSKNGTHENCSSGGTEKCNSGKFKRVNYFHGMLLTEEDFVDEQTYLREKLKLHNRLHGDGVVWGLELRLDCIKVGPRDAAITKVFIGGGLALDCAGNEIIVCERYLVPLDEKIEQLRRLGLLVRSEECSPPQYETPKLFIGIRYCECKSQPTEQYTSECADDRLRPQYSRVREGFNVQLFTAEELPGCRHANGAGSANGDSCNCPACRGLHPCHEDEQIIILGHVENYDTSTEDPDHRDAKLTRYENYRTTSANQRESEWAYPRWEAQRQNMLRSVLGQNYWFDVSPLIGRGKAEVTEWLMQRGLTPGRTYEPGKIEDEREFFEKAKYAQRWATPGSTVDLVIGSGTNCIIFLLVNPPNILVDYGGV
ncbi:MAG TPA: hypothetical protein VGX92_17315 [Pyrinomonadaceae bacterium]|jgi:hypothetical protein|nr:hypothetical protein [Pyrinomonadaceae bacterium]